MDDASDDQNGLPSGTIHLGTFTLTGKGPGTFALGVVKLWNDPRWDLLHNARSFQKAAGRCLNDSKVEPGVEILTVPGTVCAALACELFLKFIHLVEAGVLPTGHDLFDLFGSLSEPVRTSLVEHRPDIEEALQRNRLHFLKARYHHEVDQFSFRQHELLQLADSFSAYIQDHYKGETA
jgi:hypothetical protein